MRHAVKALIYRADHRILLQQRDCAPGLPWPGCWTMFGGEVEPCESLHEAMHRELIEELGCMPGPVGEELFQWDWLGVNAAHNHCFSVLCEVHDDALVLNEGQAMSWFTFEGMRGIPLTPGMQENLPKIGAFLQDPPPPHIR